MAEMISSCLGGPVSMLRSSSALRISGSSSGAGAVEDFLEMFDPSCFLVFLRSERLPCLSLIATFLLQLYLPQTSLVIL